MEKKLQDNSKSKDIFTDITYICGSTSLIMDSLKRGLDIAQLPSGDIITTEIKVINTQYTWDKTKKRMVRLSQL